MARSSDRALARLRRIIDEHAHEGFPAAELEREMSSSGKSLAFDATEIDELPEMRYGGQRTLPLYAPSCKGYRWFSKSHVARSPASWLTAACQLRSSAAVGASS
jgi:hypothetical protein